MPRFESEGFGWLVADGRRYDHDLIATVGRQLVPRPKHLSKKYGGWHTVLGPEEMESALQENPEILVVGAGHFGLLPIRPETYALLAQRGVKLEKVRIRQALARYEQLSQEGKRVVAILHLTC
ncbi:MAG: hypothetical protein HY782_12830 [Chloroflexi bacterium]|nr:hypothetical protein [Chloroflexota bacterium]